jgi:hypothetical protein
MAAKKEARPLRERAPKYSTARSVLFAPIVQAPATLPVRCCAVCGIPVTNVNLGGHDAPCAFRGHLWCLWCADGRPLQ